MDRLVIALMLALAVLLATATTSDAGAVASAEKSSDVEYFPVGLLDYYDAGHKVPIEELAVGGPPFKECSDCQCCDRSRSNCVATKCCYELFCNLPGKPPGQCSLMATACNCNNCQ